jgi:hypothetical protein
MANDAGSSTEKELNPPDAIRNQIICPHQKDLGWDPSCETGEK